jgi:hypothetical protein
MMQVEGPKLDEESLLKCLEEKLELCQQLLGTTDKLDPGFTMQRALLLKTSALTRGELAKKIKAVKGLDGKSEQDDHLTKAMNELRQVAKCLKMSKIP